ncbi:MAG: hypothetical protein IAE79_26905 [Anaerolinea sp.]|nr:hypothetical protein [Anaerolinea sp.]
MERYQLYPDKPIYFLTFSVIEWLPVFINADTCLIITDSLNFCHREKHLRVNAFVIMPTHVHLTLFDVEFDTNRLRQTLMDWRKYTGRQLADYCTRRLPAAFHQTITNTKRTDRQRQFWQQSRHPVAIDNLTFWQTKTSYLHDNPRRKGLVTDVTHWRFSSAAYWLLDPPGKSDVILTGIEW